jgi:hypothetical protein
VVLEILGGVLGPILLVPVFLAALLVVRGLPALLYVRAVGRARALAAGFMQATSLTFIVVATIIGVERPIISDRPPPPLSWSPACCRSSSTRRSHCSCSRAVSTARRPAFPPAHRLPLSPPAARTHREGPEPEPSSHGGGRAGRVGIGQGELILCAGEMIAGESAIESPKPPRSIRSNCLTSRPAKPGPPPERILAPTTAWQPRASSRVSEMLVAWPVKTVEPTGNSWVRLIGADWRQKCAR